MPISLPSSFIGGIGIIIICKGPENDTDPNEYMNEDLRRIDGFVSTSCRTKHSVPTEP